MSNRLSERFIIYTKCKLNT